MTWKSQLDKKSWKVTTERISKKPLSHIYWNKLVFISFGDPVIKLLYTIFVQEKENYKQNLTEELINNYFLRKERNFVFLLSW